MARRVFCAAAPGTAIHCAAAPRAAASARPAPGTTASGSGLPWTSLSPLALVFLPFGASVKRTSSRRMKGVCHGIAHLAMKPSERGREQSRRRSLGTAKARAVTRVNPTEPRYSVGSGQSFKGDEANTGGEAMGMQPPGSPGSTRTARAERMCTELRYPPFRVRDPSGTGNA